MASHPLWEGLHARLMLALYRSDRQAEALEAYQRARQLLADELGLELAPHSSICSRLSCGPTPSTLEPRSSRLRTAPWPSRPSSRPIWPASPAAPATRTAARQAAAPSCSGAR
ncbi:BTAD domain-containing putative transcriptional regulator [Nonomuraea sp. B12E4]|uniref:BTAD domain-containing putative transcriptional regulator n=1 Tax=Nonomuraea sp. B12E4 TaxID=3153564 RepID=UPI00325F423A